ncbi:MAG: hypothetical protein WCF92_02830 [bacterium]
MNESIKPGDNVKKESISDLVIEKIGQGNYAEAANVAGHFFASVVLDELENNKRTWIDSFNNHLTTIVMAVGMIQDLTPEQQREYNRIFNEISKISTSVINDLSNKKKIDADENEKKELMDLVHELRKIIHQ